MVKGVDLSPGPIPGDSSGFFFYTGTLFIQTRSLLRGTSNNSGILCVCTLNTQRKETLLMPQ